MQLVDAMHGPGDPIYMVTLAIHPVVVSIFRHNNHNLRIMLQSMAPLPLNVAAVIAFDKTGSA